MKIEPQVGDIVQYVGTGTKGKIISVTEENGEFWVEIEGAELLYNYKYVETIRSDKKKI
jgi:hypothetical protein